MKNKKIAFFNIRKGEEDGLIMADISKNHKRPILYQLTIKVGINQKFHDCSICLFNRNCQLYCFILENSKSIMGFITKEFNHHSNSSTVRLIPIKKNEVT